MAETGIFGEGALSAERQRSVIKKEVDRVKEREREREKRHKSEQR